MIPSERYLSNLEHYLHSCLTMVKALEAAERTNQKIQNDLMRIKTNIGYIKQHINNIEANV